MIAFAYWVFARKEKVDYAVIEVGLGGLGDSTNVISRPDKVCIITDIGMDHMHVLGDTLLKIAAQKAGIIKPHNQVVTIDQTKAVLEVFKQTAQQQQATLQIIKDQPAKNDLPPFAWRDWQLAAAAAQYIVERDWLTKPSDQALEQAAHTRVPARMEVFEVDGKTVILDGSHNQQKLAALAAGLRQQFRGQKIALLTGFVNSRADRVEDALKEVVPLVERIVITGVDLQTSRQDVQHQSLDPVIVAKACRAAGAQQIEVISGPVAAFKTLQASPEPVLLVTGSFYLLDQIRPMVRKAAQKQS
jgi:dihydrofolate synthase/folylpolyglutamate synthase